MDYTDKIGPDDEAIFWYNVLYAIGSYVIEKTKTIEHQNEGNIMLTKIFCGYWILHTISQLFDNNDK